MHNESDVSIHKHIQESICKLHADAVAKYETIVCPVCKIGVVIFGTEIVLSFKDGTQRMMLKGMCGNCFGIFYMKEG